MEIALVPLIVNLLSSIVSCPSHAKEMFVFLLRVMLPGNYVAIALSFRDMKINTMIVLSSLHHTRLHQRENYE